MAATQILFPVARLVQGSVSKPRDKDGDGNPLLIKNGPNKGQPRVDFHLGLAIPKTPGHTHWSQTSWGQIILQAGAAAFPQQYQSPSFAWKCEDGDSTVPNTKGRKPCDSEGFPGNWIVRLSSSYAPRCFMRDDRGHPQPLADASVIKTGYYVQVSGNVAGNESSQRPGVYLNHDLVLFVGKGEEITTGPDAVAVFGVAPTALPPGASAPSLVPTAGVMPVALPAAAPAPTLPAAVAVAPNPSFLAAAPVAAPPAMVPAMPVPAPVPMPPMPPAAPVHQMTTKAGGATYEACIAAGWTDAMLVAQGLMLA